MEFLPYYLHLLFSFSMILNWRYLKGDNAALMVTAALINVIGSMLIEFADAQPKSQTKDVYPIANEIDPMPPMSPDIAKRKDSEGQ